MHPKIRGKVEISSDPYNAEGVQNGVLYHRKGEEIISDFELRKLKILSVRFGIFLKNSRDKESSVARRVIDLEPNGWHIWNPQAEERLTPNFHPQKLKN